MSNIFKDVELLTITYKSSHIIFKSLKNINKNFKITIVENSKNINLKKKFNKIKNVNCVLTGKNLGFGKAFNIGANLIKSKYILHFNPDAFINNDVIKKLYQISKKKKFAIISTNETSGITRIDNKNYEELKEVSSVKGFVMFINNSFCKKVNYFDENFFLYLEEIDLCKRVNKIGGRIYLAKNIFVKHIGGKSHSPKYMYQMELQRNWHYLWSLFYFTKKHKNTFYAYKVTLRKFISSFFKLNLYFFINKKKYMIYKCRFLGLLNSYLGKESSYRAE